MLVQIQLHFKVISMDCVYCSSDALCWSQCCGFITEHSRTLYSLLYSPQTITATHTFNKSCHVLRLLPAELHRTPCPLTNFCFSHMISLGQPDPINDSQAIYMHQITLHALCSSVGGVECSNPLFFLLFALIVFAFFPQPHEFKPSSAIAPPTHL